MSPLRVAFTGVFLAVVLAALLNAADARAQSTCGAPFLTKWGSTGTAPGQFRRPMDVAVDGSGIVYVTDGLNNRVQKFTSDGTFLGEWGGAIYFNLPIGIGVDASGNVFVVSNGNARVLKFTNTGTLLTFWGSPGSGQGQFSSPLGLAVDASGHVYVSDQNNHRIQKFTNTGTYITEWGGQGSGDGQLFQSKDVRVDQNGDIYVVDGGNHRVQKFTNTGAFILKWGSFGSGDGQFNNFPITAAPDGQGAVYVSERWADFPRVQKFTDTGTYLGQWGGPGSGDGQFTAVLGIAIDGSGNLFVVDSAEAGVPTALSNDRIQKFGPYVCTSAPVPALPAWWFAILALVILVAMLSLVHRTDRKTARS